MTDHRIKLTLYRLESIMNGDIQEIIYRFPDRSGPGQQNWRRWGITKGKQVYETDESALPHLFWCNAVFFLEQPVKIGQIIKPGLLCHFQHT